MTAWLGWIYVTRDPKQRTVRYGVYLSELRHGHDRMRGVLDVILPDRSGVTERKAQGPAFLGAWIWTGVRRGRVDGQGP